ncbi:glutathione S-transferase-like protein [Melanogaster broomeanus]|nr:glutathione S-transferase-like protein [Melanogaster broomeanus]
MVLKLYGMSISTKTRSVAQICKEKEIPYELITVDLRTGHQKLPAHLGIQPFGQVPVIDDDGFILYESRAIAHPKELALFEQAASIEVTNFDPHAYGVAIERVVKVRHGEQTDEAALAKHLAALNAKLDVYDVILGKQKYLAGDYVTLADFFHLPFGTMWWNDISNRPSWLAVKNGA